jgi:hypothetical protein
MLRLSSPVFEQYHSLQRNKNNPKRGKPPEGWTRCKQEDVSLPAVDFSIVVRYNNIDITNLVNY